jgi:hypothetical protein
MIIGDGSGVPLPGKRNECVAAVKEIVAYGEQRWPAASPRMVIEDLTDGRIHVITIRASLAEIESAVAEQNADAQWQTLRRKLDEIEVPGSVRLSYSRVL